MPKVSSALRILGFLLLAVVVGTPLVGLAQFGGLGGVGGGRSVTIQSVPTGINTIELLLGRVCAVVDVIFTVLIVAVVVFVTITAFRYLTASGDAERVAQANKALIFAAVALVVALVSKAFPIIISKFFVGFGTFTGC